MIKDGLHWDITRPLTYNALFNFIMGARGIGKSFGAKDLVINRWLKKEEEFIYVRRYKDELADIETFFNDIREYYPEHKFEVKGKKFFIDEQYCGKALVLSTAKIKKSNPYPKVTTIIFDEFVIDKGVYHYLPDEVVNFLDLYETIARTRDVQVFFLSNAITQVNPYTLYFNIRIPKDKEFLYNNDILLQMPIQEDYAELKKQTRFGKMIEGTDYGRYAIDNEFLRDSTDFVEKKTQTSQNIFNFMYKTKTYGVWYDSNTGKFYVSAKYDGNRYTFAFFSDDQKPNITLLKGRHKPQFVEMFIDAYRNGQLFFENEFINGICNDIFRYTF